MLHAPVLATPNSDKTFEVVLGACATGIGAMLLQGGKLVALAGRQLTSVLTSECLPLTKSSLLQLLCVAAVALLSLQRQCLLQHQITHPMPT